MKTLTYHGPHHVSVDTVPDLTFEAPDDIILHVTMTVICGSDLHPCCGKIPGTYHDDIFGHEFMGEVMEAGSEVIVVRKGDRVVILFVITCGDCFFCRLQQYVACESINSDQGATLNRKDISPPAALFGHSGLYGGIPDGQAEYVRVPKVNTGPFEVPGTLLDEKVLFLSDILPTTWQVVRNAEVKPDSSVAIFGADPVGLLCVPCIRLNDAEQIFITDHNDYRLDFVQQRHGTILINFGAHDDPMQWIIDNTPGHRGVDAVIDAVGSKAKGSLTEIVFNNLKIEDGSGEALRQRIVAVRRGGIVNVPGVYAGFIHRFMSGDAFDRGLTFGIGQTHVHARLLDLLALTEQGLSTLGEIVTYHMPLEGATRDYQVLEKREEVCHEVILVPGMQPEKATF